MIDFAKLRDDFPMLKKTMNGKPLIYFDTAATAQKPQVMIDAMSDFYENHYGTVHRAIYQLAMHSTHAYDHSRALAKTFINAASENEIIFTKGTTEGINLVAFTYGRANLQKGDEVLISEIEHHSNIVPWQIVCGQTGAILRIAPVNEAGELVLDRFIDLLSEKTKIVSIAHISNSIGTVHPIQEIINRAHQFGAVVVIDAAQSAPHLPIDVQALDVDFLMFSGHKIYGPTGVGVLYGKLNLLKKMPPFLGGGDMIDTVTFNQTTYAEPPLKFEAGTPMIVEVIGIGTAIQYLMDIGLSHIHEHEQSLVKYGEEQLSKIPQVRVIGTAKQKGSIISFIVEGIHPLDLGSFLDLKGIALRTGHLCAQPALEHFKVTSTCRISFGLYNQKEEIDSFISHLQDAIRTLSKASSP